MSEREEDRELLNKRVEVAGNSVTVARDSIAMAKGTVEEEREMRRQLGEVVQAQNALLQCML